MIYEYMLENAAKDINKIEGNLPNFYAHAIKFASIPELQNTHWTGSMKNNGRNIYNVCKSSPSVYSNFKLNPNSYLDKIKEIIIKDNECRDLSSLKITEVFSYFDTLSSIIDDTSVRRFLSKYNTKKELIQEIESFSYNK